jgi:hypothetical protein
MSTSTVTILQHVKLVHVRYFDGKKWGPKLWAIVHTSDPFAGLNEASSYQMTILASKLIDSPVFSRSRMSKDRPGHYWSEP